MSDSIQRLTLIAELTEETRWRVGLSNDTWRILPEIRRVHESFALDLDISIYYIREQEDMVVSFQERSQLAALVGRHVVTWVFGELGDLDG